MVDLDEIETVSDDVLVTLDDQIHGFEGKYVGKKEIKGSDRDEPVYKIYYKPPQTTFGSIPAAIWSKITRSDNSRVKEFPDRIPESGLQESVSTSSDISDPAQPDEKTVLRKAVGGKSPYSDNKGDKESEKIRTLRKQKNKWKQRAQDAQSEKREAEIESDVEEDTGPAYNRDKYDEMRPGIQ